MLTFEQIKELIELVADHRLEGLKLERSGFLLKIDGYGPAPVVAAPAAPAAPQAASPTPAAAPAAAPAAPAAAEEAESEAEDESLHWLNSPIVGTFYRAPAPDAEPFVEVGDRVKKGQVLCIVEAMKLMNEIECDADGVVEVIRPANAQAVEFDEPLFGIRTA